MSDHTRTVELEQMLLARENRALRHEALIQAYGHTVVLFTMNIPGPVKAGPEIFKAFDAGFGALLKLMEQQDIRVLYSKTEHIFTGPEGYLVLDAAAKRIKVLCVQLEERSTTGRLYDIDVHSPLGGVSREQIGFQPRKCLLCERAARLCGRSRRHSVEELTQAVFDILREYAEDEREMA